MRTRLVPPILSVIGLIVGAYSGVFVAGIVEKFYAPSASSSDDLDFVFMVAMVLSCSLMGLLLSFIGFRIGKRLIRTDKKDYA